MAADGQRQREQELLDGDLDLDGLVAEGLLDAGGEGLADAQAGLHDAFAVDLRQVVVGQQEMDLVGVVAFQLGGLVEHVPTALGAIGVEVVAVDELVEDEVALADGCPGRRRG